MMIDSPCRFEELAHTAEIGVRLWAPTRQALFACAAHAMFALTGAAPDTTQPPVRHFDVALQADDAESLLVDWLSELVYVYETSGLVCAEAEIAAWTPTALTARVAGRPATEPPRLHVKAVTYHGLEIAPADEGWTATVYFDV